MKDIKRIFVFASLFLQILLAGAFGAEQVAIQGSTILPISGGTGRHGRLYRAGWLQLNRRQRCGPETQRLEGCW